MEELSLTKEQRLACILKRLQNIAHSADKVPLYLEALDARILWSYIDEIQSLVGYQME